MKRTFLSIVMIAAMMLCCGCSGNNADAGESEASTEIENYDAKSPAVESVRKTWDVVSMKNVNASEISNTGEFTVKDVKLTDSTTLMVTYQFYNKASYSRSLYGLLDCGSVSAYQNGAEISGYTVGDIDEFTDVLSGATVEIEKKYTLKNSFDPVTLKTVSTHLFWGGETYIYKELEMGTVMVENYVKNPHYTGRITKKTLTDDNAVIIDYSFTNDQDYRVTPASVMGIQAFQGSERLTVLSESMTDETHYSKCYYVDPGQTAILSTKFMLNNDEDDIVLYLTIPESADIYAKKVLSVH